MYPPGGCLAFNYLTFLVFRAFVCVLFCLPRLVLFQMPGQPQQPRRGAGPRQQRGQPQSQGGRGGPQGRGMPQQPQVSTSLALREGGLGARLKICLDGVRAVSRRCRNEGGERLRVTN